MAGLSREVLKWVQSLNLSYSIKNSKRDFANGFLIAEILSKYHPNDVQMHAFDTGTGPAARKNNWDLLERVFAKLNIPVHSDMVSEVSLSRGNTAALILTVIFNHTQKKSGYKPDNGRARSSSNNRLSETDAVFDSPMQNRKAAETELLFHVPSKNQGQSLTSPSSTTLTAEAGEHHRPRTPSALETDGTRCIKNQPTDKDADNKEEDGSTCTLPFSKGGRKPDSTTQSVGSYQNSQQQPSDKSLSEREREKVAEKNGNNSSIVITNPKAAQLLQSSQTTSESTKDFDEHMGKVAVLRLLCGIFGITDTHMSFSRSSFAVLLCREKLMMRFDSMSTEEMAVLPQQLREKERDLTMMMHHSPPTDIQLIFETFLPCITNFAADTKVLNGSFRICVFYKKEGFANELLPIVAAHTTVFLGTIMQKVFPRDCYARLTSSREFPQLLSQVSTATPEKVPFVAKVIRSYMPTSMPDAEKVRALLYLKNIINSNSTMTKFMGLPTSPAPSSDTGNPFIYFLCAIQLDEAMEHPEITLHNRFPLSSKDGLGSDVGKSMSSSQYTTLLLSECLTVVNTYRRVAAQGGLFASPSAVTEVAAAMHLLASLAKHGSVTQQNDSSAGRQAQTSNQDDYAKLGREKTFLRSDSDSSSLTLTDSSTISSAVGLIPDGVAGDIVDAHGKGYLRAILHPGCPPYLQKAYIAFLAAVLNEIGEGHPLAKMTREAAGGVLKWVGDDVLRTALIIMAGTLERHPSLCSPFVRGLTSLDESVRTSLLSIPATATSYWSTGSTTDLLAGAAILFQKDAKEILWVSWDLPFILQQPFSRIVDKWWPFGIAMGICQLSKVSLLPRCFLQILLSVSVSALMTKKQAHAPSIKDPWSSIFGYIAEDLYAALVHEDTSEIATNVLEAFIRLRGAHIANTLPSLLSSIVFLHILGQRRPRERIMKWVHRWAKLDLMPAEERQNDGGDFDNGTSVLGRPGLELLDEVSDTDARAMQMGMKELLKNFQSNFPSLIAGKPEFQLFIPVSSAGNINE
ncbi:hypothetical protein HDU76_002646 [Blyttiomyces sp. JEL0837]|nr:hypothetical protein HDU76_002646 [Blyttiomyces sp. JEL0837]